MLYNTGKKVIACEECIVCGNYFPSSSSNFVTDIYEKQHHGICDDCFNAWVKINKLIGSFEDDLK